MKIVTYLLSANKTVANNLKLARKTGLGRLALSRNIVQSA